MVRRRTPGAVRCSAPNWSWEVQTPAPAVCQSAPAQAARLAWARRPRRLSPLPGPVHWVFGSGLPLDVLGEELIMDVERRGLCDGFFKVGIAVGTQATLPSCPSLAKRSVTARDAHSAEDWRRHALFMAKPSKEPSRTERASVVLACAWMQLLKLRKTATSQGCRYDVLCGGRKHSTT